MGSIAEDKPFYNRVKKYGLKKMSKAIDMRPGTLRAKCDGYTIWAGDEKARVEAILAEAGL
jgi:hypothetical protein